MEKEKSQDELEECVTSIFGSIDCDINGRFNNNSTDDVNDGENVEVLHDDYTHNMGESVDTDDINNSSDTGTTVTALSLGNIFDLGKDRMIETKIPAVRERKQDRILRSQAFFLKVHDIVTVTEEITDSEQNSNDNTMIPNPWFRQCYRNITN